VPHGCGVAVDVGAGTGLFTRTLLGKAAQVIAVEPDARMRKVLTERSPGVRVVEGRGETFRFVRTMTIEDAVAMLGTDSRVIVAALEARFPGADLIDIPMQARCWRADRIARGDGL
jgi:phospholipid N-methyltransferase